jgi:hypothetical protein
MTGLIQIFVEGDGDVKFISDYISHIIPDVSVDIKKKKVANISIGGATKITVHGLEGWQDIQNVKPDIQKNSENGGVNLIIFDADTDQNEGGFAIRNQEIKDKISGLDYKVFLFPNNQDDGALEDLLENIINKDNASIFECWDKFEICLKDRAGQKTGKDLTLPAKKSKIYVFLEALLGNSNEDKKKIKDPFRNFNDTDHWDLDNEYLNPLKDFITKQL